MKAQAVPPRPDTPVTGAAMDRVVPPDLRRHYFRAAAAVLVLLVSAWVVWTVIPRGLGVVVADLDIVTVELGEFRDELLVRASAMPLSSVILDATEGGRVEAVYARDGRLVKQGEILFKLSNPQRQEEVLARAADVAQQVANVASLRVGLQSSVAEYRRNIAALEYELDRVQKAHTRNSDLAAQGFLSPVVLEESRDKVTLQQRLLREARADLRIDLETRTNAIEQMDKAIVGLNQGLRLVRANIDALAVKAPADGRLTDFHMDVGQSVKAGDRMGRIDSPDLYKLVARVDEFYLNRLTPALTGNAEINGETVAVTVARINPQVRDRTFAVELTFGAATLARLQPGQTVDTRITLGRPSRHLLLPDAAFFADTGGAWVFVASQDGGTAERRAVQLGRRAGGRIEVLGGLKAGERVVVSSYRSFATAERLRLQ